MNDDNKTYLTCKDIAKLLGVTHRHVLNVLSKKNISTEKDESGKHIVQKSEFFRVFPKLMNKEQSGTEEKSDGNQAMKLMEEKIRHLQEMLDEKKKQNEFLMGQISLGDDKQTKMLDAINAHSRLLEFKEATKSTAELPSSSSGKAGKKFSIKKLFGKE